MVDLSKSLDIMVRKYQSQAYHHRLIFNPESALIPDLAEHNNVKVCPLGAPGAWLKKLPFIIAGPLKVLYQIYSVGWALLYETEPTEWLIVQVHNILFHLEINLMLKLVRTLPPSPP